MNLNVTLTPPESYMTMPYDEILDRIAELKKKLGKDLLILGHHYQMDDIIQFADIRGDSLALSKKASEIKGIKYLIFCGVHFMAEVADILTDNEVKVILPDLQAGCTMADMADIKNVETAWNALQETKKPSDKIIPITYINCDANLKAFVGRHGGSICTSGNAEKIIRWALSQGNKLFFFPDQHLGRNTSHKLGIALDDMCVWRPKKEFGGNTKETLKKSKVILWDGCCSVHTKFRKEHINYWRKKAPDINIIVHPECTFEVNSDADYSGSTAYIIKKLNEAPKGSKWAVGTESNLVGRLQKEHPDKSIVNLSSFKCICGTMYRIRPPYLLNVLEKLTEGKVINQIKVEDEVVKYTKVALDRMFEITNAPQ